LHRTRTERNHREVALDAIDDLAEPAPESLPPVDPEQLQQALNDLAEDFRTPIVLYYFEEFSYRDIAEQMDLPLGTVMSRLARAKAHLRSRLLPPVQALAGQRRGTNGL
jgi:RNA polymerase sigma-70 factor (ECF subfamily)